MWVFGCACGVWDCSLPVREQVRNWLLCWFAAVAAVWHVTKGMAGRVRLYVLECLCMSIWMMELGHSDGTGS